MHLVALVERVDHVCCRYRLAAFRPYLEAAGHSLELRELPRSAWSRLRLLHSLSGANVIVQRKLLPIWERHLLRRAARRLLFDFDDAVFLRDSYSRRGLNHPGLLRRFGALVRDCDAIVAGNEHLAGAARRYTAAGRVVVVPTCVDPARYPIAEHMRTGADVRLVWIGSSSTLQGLEAITPLLDEIGRRVPGLRLQLICDRFVQLAHLSVIATPWSDASEGASLSAADIGISWVPDDDWSRGKCGLKLLQYMAAGLPVVTNPVGVHPTMVRHGENGLLARTSDEWIEAIARLAKDAALRRQMGAAGRRRVEAEYGVAVGARRWSELLSALDSPQSAAG